MPDLSHLWQRFLLTSTLVVGIAIGALSTAFGFGNQSTVTVRILFLHLDSVPLWAVAVVPVAVTLVASTLYHWMDGLHHFTEHMRHRSRVRELESEVKSLRQHLDHVLEMPGRTDEAEKRQRSTALPHALEGVSEVKRSDPDDLSELASDDVPALEAPKTTEPVAKADAKPRRKSSKPRSSRKKSARPRGGRASLKASAAASSRPDVETIDARGPFVGADGETMDLEDDVTHTSAVKEA
jgi:hypothetical protein